jgi:NADH-quinone oxidoreductase subunit N
MLAYGVIIRSTKVSLLRVMTDMSILILISTLIIENANNLIKSFILLSAIMILLASREEFSQRKSKVEDSEYNQILMLAVLAMMLMISTKDMITMYLAIETMSLSSYIMATLRKTAQYSTEAGLKYIVLGAISSGIILLGISQIYIITGSFQ